MGVFCTDNSYRKAGIGAILHQIFMEKLKNNQIRDCYNLEKGLTLFHRIREESVFTAFNQLLWLLFRKPRSSNKIVETYHQLCALLLERSFSYEGPGDLWQDFLLTFLLQDENPATCFLEQYPLEKMGGSLRRSLEQDLSILQSLFQLTGTRIQEIVQEMLDMETLVCWDEPTPVPCSSVGPPGKSIRNLFFQEGDWQGYLPQLADFFKQEGAGLLNQYYAFRWEEHHLVGISQPDPITFSRLYGYHREKKAILKNTRQFVAGLPASNVLLCGERGTGKSSLVKALIHELGPAGLRIIEFRGDPTQLTRLYPLLQGRGLAFILFMDDLSFQEGDDSFRELKALLEGRIHILPSNTRIYATSNLRHLVEETFSQRKNGDSVHPGDLFQERLSLVDRFGLTLFFSRPDQSTYLHMISQLAKDAGICMDPETLKAKALTWSRRFSTPNGRTARQFIDHLVAKNSVLEESRVHE